MTTNIVTGAAGFIGSIFARSFDAPILIDKLRRSNRSIHVAEGSKFDQLNEIFKNYADSKEWNIYHFGGESSTEASLHSCYVNNYLFTTNLLKIVERNPSVRVNLFFASSASVYGNLKIQKEDRDVQITSAYAASKYGCEKLIAKSAQYLPNLNKFIIGRLFNVVPVGNQYTREQHKLGTNSASLPTRMAYEGFSTIYNMHLDIKRDFIDISQAEDIIHNLMDSAPSGIYNIGYGKSSTFLELFHLYTKLYMLSLRETSEERAFDMTRYQLFTQADLTKVRPYIQAIKS